MAPPDSISTQGPDIDRGSSLIALYISLVSLASTFMALRIWSRTRVGGIGYDDLFLMLGLAIYIGLAVIVVLFASAGGTRHVYYLTDDMKAYVTRLNYIARPFVIFGIGSVKIAVCLLIFRVLGPTLQRLKYYLTALVALNSTVDVLAAILTFAQCDVPAALWEPSLAPPKTHCWDPSIQSDFSIFNSALNVAVDFTLTVVPGAVVWRLNLSTRKRIGLNLLFGTGLVSVIAAAYKTQYLSSIAFRADLTWETYNIFAWACAEIFVLHLCASVPTYKPLWDRYIRRKKSASINSRGYRLPDYDTSLGVTNWEIGTEGTQYAQRNPPQDNSILVLRSVAIDWESSHNLPSDTSDLAISSNNIRAANV
ncbi:hypothetical protein F4777DRAFT_139484 [Nemania sp. FL0916]|nr:hypothetical protein F4777DRAFT_139484 [Nemania sp. FL0916]